MLYLCVYICVYIYVFECFALCVCSTHVLLVAGGQQRKSDPMDLGTCEPPCQYWEPNPRPLEEPSLQPQVLN